MGNDKSGNEGPFTGRNLAPAKKITKRKSNNEVWNYKCSMGMCILFVVLASLLLAGYYTLFGGASEQGAHIRGSELGTPLPSYVKLPSDLIGLTYSGKDFPNDAGVVPTYWNCSRVSGDCENRHSSPFFHRHDDSSVTWGPCYAIHGSVEWRNQVEQESNRNGQSPSMYAELNDHKIEEDTHISGLCRPGFVILGAGKCGTR